MTIETDLTRIADALETLVSFSIPQAGAAKTPETPPPAAASRPLAADTEKRGRGRPRKEEPAQTPPVDVDPFDTKPDVDSSFDEPEPPKVYTADDVRAALVSYQKRATPEKARALLKEVGGADTLKSLNPTLYGKVVEAAEKA